MFVHRTARPHRFGPRGRIRWGALRFIPQCRERMFSTVYRRVVS